MNALHPHGWSLTVKIPLTIAIVVVGVAVTIGVSMVAHDRARFRAALEDKALLKAHAIAATAAEALLQGDSWSLYQSLKQVTASASRESEATKVIAGMVLDAEGRVMAHLDPANNPSGLPFRPEDAAERDSLDKALSARTPVVLSGEREKEGFLEAVVPIFADDKFIGAVRLRMSTAELTARNREAAATVLGLTLGLAAIGSLLGAFLSRRMVGPLCGLARGLESIGRGDDLANVAPVAVRDLDEVGRLAARFNRMTTELADKKRLEQQVALNEKLAGLGRIAAGVAHEVNNPLGGMLNCVDTLKKHPGDPELLRRYLNLLETGLNRIASTVRGLLVELHDEVPPKPCGLACLSDLKHLVGAEIAGRNVRLRWENLLDGEACLRCSCPHLQQIVLNLAKNGVQAMPDGGSLAVRSRREESALVLEIEDSGIGISEQDQRHLFDPFFTKCPDGSGLGLWITFRLVQRMGGSIHVESQPGRGSRFEVRLPLTETGVREAAQ
jgi:signal transduction histidine kinase